MVTLVAGSGVGKSMFIGEMAHHILTNTQEKIAIMMLEESVEMANLRLMSIAADRPLHIPGIDVTDEQLQQYAKDSIELVDDDGNPRVVSFDHFGSNSVDEILFRIEHFAALGCKYIFLDHISIIVSDQQSGDERKVLDEIATKLRMKVQEYDVCLFLVSHLRRPSSKPHEEGGQTSLADIRGTAGIGQLSDIVIGLERNGQDEDPIERNTTRVRVLKNRFCGTTGLTSALYFDHKTGRLIEVLPSEDDDDDEGSEENDD
jgi:twinkle protein